MKVIASLCLALFSTLSIAQSSNDIDLERLIDELFPVQDEDFNYEDLYENYAQRILNPLNLNQATAEQLRSLAILNPLQLNEFLKYRSENAPLLSLTELQVIDGFDDRVIQLLKPFVTIDNQNAKSWKGIIDRMMNEPNNYWVTRLEQTLEKKEGYQNTSSPAIRYNGSPLKWYNRFRTSSPGDFSIGLTMEKDAGEPIKWSPKIKYFGFDFISGHLQIQNKGFIKNIIVGDYQAQFGQGLTLGGGFGIGKGSETITSVRRSNLGFIPYTSAVEFGYFRGFATSIAINQNFTIHPFASQTYRDGNSSITDSLETISSFLLSGLHRTENEILSRRNIREVNYGSVIQFNNRGTDLGIIAHHTEFSKPLIRTPSLYNQFSFNGIFNTNLGLYWNQNLNNISLFSELSHSINYGTAYVAGILASVSSAFDLAIHYRNFDPDYYGFYSNAISENTTAQNEKGFYLGTKYKFNKAHSVSGYIDLFQFPWLRFRSYQPSTGNEWLLRYSYQPSKNIKAFAQIRQETKVRNVNENTSNYTTAAGTKVNYWVNVDYELNDFFSFKTRLQYVTYSIQNKSNDGIVLIQDLNCRWRKFILSSRIAFFDTDNYDTRLYTYEKDAWLSFSIPALQGVGIRQYVMLQYKISKKIDIWLRWAKTEYENQDTISSGGETINGNQKNDLKGQLRIRL